jgi:L-lactate dehydrogenase complex protein LldF
MAETIEVQFRAAAEIKTFDPKHRKTLNHNIGKYNVSVKKGLEQYVNHEEARRRGNAIKASAIAALDRNLLEWESHFTARGGKVIWATTAQDALQEIVKIMKRRAARLVVKSKSMTTEEVNFNEYLAANGIESFETDLGEYIVQLAGERPYHIVTPAMHMSKADVAELFEKKLGHRKTDSAEELVGVARQLMREKYTEADIGVTGANFLVADCGAVAVTENEGNARLSVTFPKTHIVIAGIEKVIERMEDLHTMWPLLSTSGTGQQLTVYNTLIMGPRQEDEQDGPAEMYVILLDNGRTKLLADPEKRQALYCIRCGACLNACPVYKNIGGHAYNTTYSGPIGSVLTPQYEGMENFKHLSFASSLCGACTTVCPVKIDLHNLLLLNRQQSVEEGHSLVWEKRGFWLWRFAMQRRWALDIPGAKLKQFGFVKVFGQTWSNRRAHPHFPAQNFRKLWKSHKETPFLGTPV